MSHIAQFTNQIKLIKMHKLMFLILFQPLVNIHHISTIKINLVTLKPQRPSFPTNNYKLKLLIIVRTITFHMLKITYYRLNLNFLTVKYLTYFLFLLSKQLRINSTILYFLDKNLLTLF